MDPFLVKMGRTGQKTKKKNHFMYRLCPTRNAVFPTKSKKIKKRHSCFISSKIESGQAKKEGKKIFVLVTVFANPVWSIPKKNS